MSRPCPAAAYLSSLSSQGATSSSFNTDDLDPTRSFEYRKSFLRELADFMHSCHTYVKKIRKQQTKKEFKMTDAEKNDHLQELLGILKERERKIQQRSVINTPDRNRNKISFVPRGRSSAVTSPVGHTQMTGSPVSPVSNIMGPRELKTIPGAYKSTQGSSGFSGLNYKSYLATKGSSISTDTGSPDVLYSQGRTPVARVCGPPERSAILATSYPGYSSYTCPYKQQSINVSPAYYPRTRTTARSQYATPPYQGSYVSAPSPQNATAQTSFYEVPRGRHIAEYYEDELGEGDVEVDLNTAYIDDEDAYVTDYEEAAGQEEYTEYDTPSGRVICACR